MGRLGLLNSTCGMWERLLLKAAGANRVSVKTGSGPFQMTNADWIYQAVSLNKDCEHGDKALLKVFQAQTAELTTSWAFNSVLKCQVSSAPKPFFQLL